MKFKAGDIVKIEGVLMPSGSSKYPLLLSIKGNESGSRIAVCVTEEGLYLADDTTPFIQLVSRPKKMVKKTMEKWANVYVGGATFTYSTIEHADNAALFRSGVDRRIACVKLVGEYEVEESDE